MIPNCGLVVGIVRWPMLRWARMVRLNQLFLGAAAVFLMLLGSGARLHAACSGCTTFNPGVFWGTNTYSSLGEASGLAFSVRNPGVLWSHNDDGDDGRLFAFRTNGAGLARFQMNLILDRKSVV